MEKFDIERVYWERRKTDWGIVTELQIPKTFARNISYIHDYHDLYLHGRVSTQRLVIFL